MTFDFSVKQRLDVMECLNELLKQIVDVKKQAFIKQKINAQAYYLLIDLLKENLDEKEIIMREVKSRSLAYMPFFVINKGLANKLVISFCFPPYVDTSGNVMAKRIRNMNDVVEVIYNKMDKVREVDPDLNLLIDDLIENRIEISILL